MSLVKTGLSQDLIMNFARSFLGTLMRTILVVCILNGCVIVLSLF